MDLQPRARPTPMEAVVGQLDQGFDSDSVISRQDLYCQEVPVSGVLTTGSLDPVPCTAGLLFLYANINFIIFGNFRLIRHNNGTKSVIWLWPTRTFHTYKT